MLDAVQSGEYYQDDEFLPESPLLEARIAKTPQSITPPPIVATSDYSSGLNGSNIPRSQDEENLNRRKKDVKVRTRPTQGDWVLIREMDPNRPDAPVPIRGPGFPALRAQIERFDNKLREEKANSIYAEGNASTPVTQVVRRQRPSNRFQPVVGERIQLEEGECTAAEEAERAAKELEAARKATEEQQQSHQERNTRRPEDSFDDILEHSPASLPSTSLSSRPVSNRQPIIIQSSPPINQQSSTALAPPADASVATSHNEGPPHRGLSRNIADQGEEVPHVGSLSQSALKDKTQEINKASTEKISRRQNVPPSSQGPGRTTYDPNAPAPARRRHNIRPEIHLSQSTRDVNRPSHEDVLSMRSDPTPSPYYQSYYSHAGAVIQPATTRPRRHSVSRPVSYSGNTNHACSICGKTFSRTYHRRDHELSHKGERPHECEECGRAFTRLNDLTRHKKLHDEPGNNGAGETGPQYHWTQGAPGGYYDPRASTNMNHRSGSGYSSYVPLKPSSPSSDVAVYGEGDTKSMSTHGQASDSGKNEIRLRVDANAPLSLQFNGDMEGRTMRLIPEEDGMAELVISGNDADLYKAVQERRRQNRRPIVYEQSPAASDSSTADALETIHSPNALEPRQKWGRHSDLMPENILRLPELENGILVIPDLGLTRYKSTQSRSNAPGEGLSATAGSEDDPEGVEIPEAQTPFRHHLKDKGSPEHRDHVVQKARADETMAIEYTNSQRGADVPLEDPIPRALKRVSRRQSVVDFGEKEEKIHDEHKEEEVQFRAKALYNHSPSRRPQSAHGNRPSSGSYLARSKAARRDPRYYDPSHIYSRRAAVIEPATTRRLRRPSVVTRPVTLAGESGPQYHRPEVQRTKKKASSAPTTQFRRERRYAKPTYHEPRPTLSAERQDTPQDSQTVPLPASSRPPSPAARSVAERLVQSSVSQNTVFSSDSAEYLAAVRRESLASDHTAAATKSSSQPSPKEYTTRTEQQKELKKKSERQSHSPSPVDLEKIMSEMVQKAMDQAEREGRPEENMVLMDMVTKLMNKGPVSSHTGQRRNSKDTLHDDTFGQLPRRMNDLRSDTKRTHAAATYSVSSDEYETTSDSGIEPDSPVPLSPVSKDLRKIQKTDDSELEVEEKQTKQTTLSAWDGEVLQKSREVQIDAVVGSPGDNESLAVEVEEYPDANLKHRRPVADSNRSTGIIASEKSVTDVQTDDTVDSGYESALSIREYDHIKAWLGARSVNKSEVYSGSGYDGAASGSSSYAASVVSIFSVASLASSASDISRGSGYSAVQIATATKVLLSVFYEDKTLLSLYKNAIGNENIGPERLQRNLRRLFRAYAGLLENEATERLEYLSSRLVLIKSAFLAQSIVEKLQNGQVGARSPRSERNEESSDEEDDSSNTHLVNEDAFEDLAIFREFLVGSGAFRTFRDQLEAFVLPKPIHLTHEELIGKREASNATTMKPVPMKAVSGHRNVLTWQKWCRDAKLSTDGLFHGAYLETTATSLFHLMMDAISLATDDLLVASGRLEPPLSPNMVRLRWQCACGDSLHSDVSELRKGGVEELISHMQRTSGAKVLASPHSHQSGNQKYVMPNPTQWIQKAFTSIFGGSAKKSAACLPQHNTSCTSTTTANAPPPQRGILHLLACMHRNRLRKDLKQDRIEDITTDRALLCFLRKQYRLHRGRFLHALSLQSVKGISFVKFRLPIGGSVDVRHHDPCCVADTTGPKTCECIPPPPKVEPSPGAEYRCIPGPPATYPPIPPVYLASLFTCPTDVHEKDTWILDQLPKRTCGELKGQIGQPAEGWGIYYDEGLDGDMLAWTILIVFLVASLLFGVLWSKFQYDIQGAFGVSAYMVACCAAVLPVIVTKLGNKG